MLTLEQLTSALPREALDNIAALGLDAGDPNPLEEEVRFAVARVAFFTQSIPPNVLPQDYLDGLARDIAIHNIVKRLGTVTEDQVRAYERALKELDDLARGEHAFFKSLNKLDHPPRLLWGSAKKISTEP